MTHKRRYFKGRKIFGQEVRDIRWLNTDGNDMTEDELNTGFIRCLGMLLNGELMTEMDELGEVIKDDILLLIVNSYWEPLSFSLPHQDVTNEWELLIDTSGKSNPRMKMIFWMFMKSRVVHWCSSKTFRNRYAQKG